MKKAISTIITGALLCSGVAYADYECVGHSDEVSMKVDENNFTRVGNTFVLLVNGTEKTPLLGTLHSTEGDLLEKKVISLHPYQGDKLTIVSKPRFCGRGSCDHDAGPVITASLKLGETLMYFSCHETNQ